MGSAQWQEAAFIVGEFRKPAAGGTIGVRDKASGEIFGTAGMAGEADVDRATVVTGVSRDSRLWTEEIFAPIASIGVVDDADEAVTVANDTRYGLVDSVLTGDPNRGLQLARRLRAGMVHVNDATPQDEALAPFGVPDNLVWAAGQAVIPTSRNLPSVAG